MAFLSTTLIELPHGLVKEIDRLEIGDSVLAAGFDLQWQPHVLEFAMTTSPIEFPAIYLLLENERELVVTNAQPMLSAGKLVRADQLTPVDTLTDKAGQPVKVRLVSRAPQNGFVTAVATAKSEDAPHLLLAYGVVVGDYELEISE